MNIQRLLMASTAALAASIPVSYAGPCSNEIDHMQAEIDAKFKRNAATGPAASESTDATMHRQPTPGSIAAAEEGVAKRRLRRLPLSRPGHGSCTLS